MPRTKRPARRQEKQSEGVDDVAKNALEKLTNELKQHIDSRAELDKRDIELNFKIFMESALFKTHHHKTLRELKLELHLKEVANIFTNGSTSQDDGYGTANSSHGSSGDKRGHFVRPATVSRTSSRRSRSADTSRKIQVQKTVQRKRTQSVFKTPMYTKPHNACPPVTPKVDPQTALALLRQPRQGEMVMSMSGSPVMVTNYSSMQQDEKANCQIMLKDGTVLSVMPKELRQSQTFLPLSLMNSPVMKQLETLKNNLETLMECKKGLKK